VYEDYGPQDVDLATKEPAVATGMTLVAAARLGRRRCDSDVSAAPAQAPSEASTWLQQETTLNEIHNNSTRVSA
jgi:hypothetical protein